MARLSRSAPLSPSCSFLCLSGRGQSTGTTELTCRVALWVVRFSEAETGREGEHPGGLGVPGAGGGVDRAGGGGGGGREATAESLGERERGPPPRGAAPFGVGGRGEKKTPPVTAVGFRVSDETTG